MRTVSDKVKVELSMKGGRVASGIPGLYIYLFQA
jgi:hypothetical protein